MGRVLRAIQASLVVVVATVTPAWADFDRNLDLTAPGGGLTPQSQWDPRWRDFGIGPLTVTLGECGCLVTNLATMMDYHIGGPGPGTSLPWFPVFHKNPATGGFDEDFVWSPAYIDLYLTSGPDPQRPRASGWGYKIGGPGTCGVWPHPSALTRAADPVRDPVTRRPLTPVGVSMDNSWGLDTAVIDRNLRADKPTLVVKGNGDGTGHSQVIAGWRDSADFKGYLIADPMARTGSRAVPAGTGLGGSTAQERYDKWVASVQSTQDVQPVHESFRWLWFLDDPEPIEMMVIDPQGRRQGFDPASGEFVEEHPSASYWTVRSWADPLGELPADELKRDIAIRDPVAGTYGFQVVGTGVGPFTVRFGRTDVDQVEIFETVQGTITKDQIRRYEVEYDPTGGASVVEVPRFAPRARAGRDQRALPGSPVSFDGSQSFEVGGSITSYHWDFGDGAGADGVSATHAYAAPGTYTVTLTVENAAGDSATDTAHIVVIDPGAAPEAVTVRASLTGGGDQVFGNSFEPALSADGRFVAFASLASGLTANDLNGIEDIYVKDLAIGAVERVSVSSDGSEAEAPPLDPRGSNNPALTSDGRYVAFSSTAENLVPGDTNGEDDVFVHDRTSGTTERVSVGPGGAQGNADSIRPAISSDGRYVAFESGADNLVVSDTNPAGDIFVHDRMTGTTEVASLSSTDQQVSGTFIEIVGPAISADGRYVAFQSRSPDFVPGDLNQSVDVFVRDRQSGTTERASLSHGGGEIGDDGFAPSISADGRFVAFHSEAPDVVPSDTNGVDDVFVRDRVAGTTERVSVSSDEEQASGGLSLNPTIAADGRYVAFYSTAANLVPGDTNSAPGSNGIDVFRRDLQTGETERVSVSTGGDQALPNVGPPSVLRGPAVSTNGAVAFHAPAENLVADDTNSSVDVFVRRPLGPKPLAALTGPYVGWASGSAHPTAVRLEGSASADPHGRPLTATWDFGDGTPTVTGPSLTASHAYSSSGRYTATLTVDNGLQKSDPVATVVEVFDAPVDSLSVSPTCGPGGTTLEISGAAAAANPTLLSRGWDLATGPVPTSDVTVTTPWGDLTAPTALPTFSFDASTVVPLGGPDGELRLSTGPAEATFLKPCPPPGNLPPDAHAGGPYAGSAGAAIAFDGTRSLDAEGASLTYEWDFGDGESGTGSSPQHAYRRAGRYFVTLVVNDGGQDSALTVGTRSFALATVTDAPPPVGGGGTDSRGQAPASAGAQTQLILGGCLNAEAAVRGRQLGPAALGRTRAEQRRVFSGARLRSRNGLDRYCATGGGSFRIGYPTKRLLGSLPRATRRRVRGRVVLILTSSTRFSLNGIRPGDQAAAARRRLRDVHARRVGRNQWYVTGGSAGRALVVIRAGLVRSIGIGDTGLIRVGGARRFLTAWNSWDERSARAGLSRSAAPVALAQRARESLAPLAQPSRVGPRLCSVDRLADERGLCRIGSGPVLAS